MLLDIFRDGHDMVLLSSAPDNDKPSAHSTLLRFSKPHDAIYLSRTLHG